MQCKKIVNLKTQPTSHFQTSWLTIQTFLPTFHTMVWRLKERIPGILKLLFTVNKIGCYVPLIIVKILQYVKIKKNWNHPFCLSKYTIWAMLTYQRIRNMMIVPIPIFHSTMLLTKLIRLLDKVILTEIYLRPTKNEGVQAPTNQYQIKFQEEKITPRKQEIQECK